ncbi:MAG TPA: flagella basal body P-ring formation protein FlgA, partial [Polyangiaceae bacterium]
PKALKLPPSLRIEAAAERWNAVDVAAQADSTVRAALPPGVTLVKLTATRGVVVPPGTRVSSVRPQFPKRAGRHTVTAVAELSSDEDIVARTPLSLVLEVSEAALEPLVKKGDRVNLVIQYGNARVGASGLALADANAGESVWFKVATTGKVLKAKVTSRDTGLVVEP